MIDLSQFDKPKKKKEDFKKDNGKPAATGQNANAGQNANKNKRKRIAPKPGEKPAITGGNNAQGGPSKFGNKPGFQKETVRLLFKKLSQQKKRLKTKSKKH